MTDAADRIGAKSRARSSTHDTAGGPDPDAQGGRDALFVGSVEKCFRVLQAFRDASPSLSLTEIAKSTGLGKSAAQRFCHTFVSLGYLERDPQTRRLKPTSRLLEFSYIYLASNHVSAIAAPFLLKAREECGQAVNLALPHGNDVIYVIRLPSLNSPLSNPLIGGTAPMFCTSSGRSYLSALPPDEATALIDQSPRFALTAKTITDRDEILTRISQARQDGFTTANQECIAGEITVGSPIFGRGHRGVGAMNICVNRPDWSLQKVVDELAPIACRTAHEISQALSASPAG